MQIGGNNSHGAAGGRSVGQRIKEASLKEFQLNTAPSGGNDENENNAIGDNNAFSNNSNGVCVIRATRTAALLASAEFGGVTKSGAARRSPVETVQLTEKQRNTIRIIGQYLRDLGMADTVDTLVEESGCRIENALAVRLQELVLAGAWARALVALEKLRASMSERQYATIRVLLLEERFKQLVLNNQNLAALHLLQVEYPKDPVFKDRHEYLATALMNFPILTSETCETNGFFAFDSDASAAAAGALFGGEAPKPPSSQLPALRVNEGVLRTLQKILPTAFLLPPKRLDTLLDQAWKYQVQECKLHVSATDDDQLDCHSILRNHNCKSIGFPTKTIQILSDHHMEVWCLEFSPCGRYLASGAKSNTIIVWLVDPSTYRLGVLRRLCIPVDVSGIVSLSWSADSRLLAAAASEDNAGAVYVFHVHTGALAYEHQPTSGGAANSPSSFSSVSFFSVLPDAGGANDANDASHAASADASHAASVIPARVACGDQRGNFHVFDVDQNHPNVKYFEGFRIRCLYAMSDGKTVLAADTHNRIRSYDFESMQEGTVIQESSQIIYFTVDSNERFCLITTKTEGIRLWSLCTKTLVRSFFGSMHQDYVVSTSFGGTAENFFASGSEDDNVVIWNIEDSYPIKRLVGHAATVNTVSWNPMLPGMLVSGADDCTIRVWASQRKYQLPSDGGGGAQPPAQLHSHQSQQLHHLRSAKE